ncbi:hypothetical protein [Candidatus Sneabacter namystus]|uniref:VUT family protein n=1 Tax=Candidatus Sneabacter namystus TaxID=2601646 RepID=A0A5C0UH83_9RICK|nr:hypothetical protein [Candidatus Sneabacter namystus]QEK39426.1 hypothetical protein FZC37_00520 [Candidatus Sneabacter namystus]
MSVNIIYLFCLLSVAGLSYGVNAVNKVYQCAVMFVILSFVANYLASISRLRTVLVLFSGIMIGFLFHSNHSYTIAGKVIHYLILTSSLSMFCSIGAGALLSSCYLRNMRFWCSAMIGSMLSSVIDCTVMFGFFLTKFSLARSISIFTKEIMYKGCFVLIMSLTLFSVSYFGECLFVKKGKGHHI